MPSTLQREARPQSQRPRASSREDGIGTNSLSMRERGIIIGSTAKAGKHF
jgi:hypothetical protein